MIEVNDYVRTKNGKIDKVINSNFYMSIYVECEKGLYLIENIVKHSKKLIDLIEVGDYVNGREVIEVREQEGKIYLMTGYVPQTYIKEDIKSIVTHEQMASIEYKVEEDR